MYPEEHPLYDPNFSTTFRMDFSIADRFGKNAVIDTYKRAFAEWKDNFRYLTDLVITLNHKLWEHYEAGHETLARAYNDLWMEADHYAMNNLKDQELSYFWVMTD